MSNPVRKLTAEEFIRDHSEDRAELIHGEVVPKALADLDHSSAQGGILSTLARRFHRNPGGKWPGGWWLQIEVDVVYETHELFCHDAAGWKRERMPERPAGRPSLRPDWVLEVISPGHERRDRVDKWDVIHRHGVPHYWLFDRHAAVLEVYRWHADGYRNVLQASKGQIIRAEPFDAVELRVSVLLGDEDDEE